MLMALLMGLLIYPLKFLGLGDLCTLGLQTAAGAGVYVAISCICKSREYQYIVSFAKQRLGI